MDREQMINHLVLQGWEPYARYAIVHPELGTIGRYSDGRTYWYASSIRSLGYGWDDISDVAMSGLMVRMNYGRGGDYGP